MPKDKRQEIPAVRTLQAFDPSSNTASRSSRSNNPAVQDTGGSSQNSHNSNDATVSTARLPLVQAAATISQNSHLTTSFSTAGSSKAAIDPKGRVATMGDVLSGTQSALAPIRAKYQELSDDKAKCGSERTPLDRGCSG